MLQRCYFFTRPILIKDQNIRKVGEEGTQNILNAISDKCKIIFPSTHVVFEGIDEIKTNIKEEEKTPFSCKNVDQIPIA